MKTWLCIVGICAAFLAATDTAGAGKISACYTKVDSGLELEKYSRTGPYADIVVVLDTGRLVFWRGSSYLPYWETQKGKSFVEEVIPRKGDGPPERPDKVNTYSRVAIIKDGPEEVVVYWRYLPQFGGKNPHTGVDATKFVDEYFTISPDGNVVRTIRRGTAKIDDWRDSANKIVQTFRLTPDGLVDKKIQCPSLSGKPETAKGTPVKTKAVGNPVAWWKFNEAQDDVTVESVSGQSCIVEGHKSLWKKGVSGTALQFDGYNSLIRLPAAKAPKVSSALTLEGWIAIGAYPWSWTPIIQQADDVEEVLLRKEGPEAFVTGEDEREDMEEPSDDFTFVLKKEDDVGYFLGIDGLGRPGLKLKVGDTWEELTSGVHLERKRWYHIAATYDKDTGKMSIYVDGKPAGDKNVAKSNIVTSNKDVQIGKGKPRRPIKPVRSNTFIDSYGFDGLIDEVRIHDVALNGSQISQSYKIFKPDQDLADMADRVLPEGKGTGKFGAYYDHLDFYETWDNLWRFSEHPDVVVEFDELPSKFVFWRGVGYIPMMVNDKGHWYTNEFNETWNTSGGQGCQEPMSDKESYTNHAKIIENTPARVVVQWRYPLIDVLHVTANYNEDTGWGDWSDWYYYIYPDGVAVKTMHLWTHGERNHEWHESIAVFGPDQHPEDVLEKEPALMLIDLKGNIDKYNWIKAPPDDISYRQKKIHIVNYRSDYDMFTIGDFRGGDIYGGELTPYAVFPTWNHWPVGQMPSDGRYASFPDRTGHSSLTHVELPTYKEDFGDRPYQEKILMEGVSNKSPKELVPLAKSWLTPAGLEVKSGCTSEGYDRGQRAYLLTAKGTKISAVVKASEESPVVNPALVIENWGEKDASLTVDGEKIECGKDFRQGHRRRLEGTDLIVWFKKESTKPVEITIATAD